jgi:chorismate mutase / prephenate dehydratase
MSDEDKLTDLRQKIDVIDLKLTKLVSERARLALQAGIIKGWKNIQRPEREEQVIRNITAANKGPLSDDGIQLIFRTIVRVCRTIQYNKPDS